MVEVPDARASLGLERDSLLALAATLSGDALIQFCGGPMDTEPMGAVPHGVCCPEDEICFELPPIDVIGECDEGKIREPGSDHCVCENDSPEPDCWVDDDPHNPGGG